ncbi:MAG: hypothetical protein A3G41_05200 [Elusimicrobia bacterium RIFCSPLOWO2_12_FULL_59_9]|nr:MAG: hypothetical protein A3G41_05200 [Elusimicrobia bacterium RIFCSPLOWO2_12_FULL_59_9]
MEQQAVQRITGLGPLDLAILAAGISALFGVAYFSGREEKDTQDFFLARRHIPWWAASLSFIATEISALTIVGVPAAAFRENWQYLQFFIGSAMARLTIAFLFIPAFYRYRCTTIYEFLSYRFSPNTQRTASIFFFITRLVAAGVRLYAASLAVAVILGWELRTAIALFSVVSILYIGYGGIKAVVWTNVLQAFAFIGAGVACLLFLYSRIPGGSGEIFKVAGESGKLSLINLSGSLGDPTTLWIATLNGLFGSLSAFGTDHELMQRLLTVDTRKASQKTMVTTIFIGLPVTMLFLSIGTLLFVYYRTHPGLALPENTDKILSHFIVYEMPQGLKGLMLMAILMASIDSPLSSLTASFVTDIYRSVFRPEASERHYMAVSRAAIVVFGLILAVIAYGCRSFEGMLWFAFKINGVTAGSLLGIFLLGLLTRRRANAANTIAMVTSAFCMGCLLYLSEMKLIDLAWSWLIVIGTVSTFVGAWLLGPRLDWSKSSVADAPADAPPAGD